MKVRVVSWRPALGTAFALLVLLFPFHQAKASDMSWPWPVKGSGVIIKQARALAPFDSMKVRTRAAIEVRLGGATTVEVQADDNIVPLVEIAVRGSTLYIEDLRSLKPTVLKITIGAKALDRIASADAAAVHVAGLSGSALSVSVGGTSAVSLAELRVASLRVDLGNKGVQRADGSAASVVADLGGATAFSADRLRAESVSLNMGGSSQATVWATAHLKLSLGGSTAVSYFGQPKLDVTSGGSASVKHLGAGPPAETTR